MQDPEKRIDLIPGSGAMGMPGMGGMIRMKPKTKREVEAAKEDIVDLAWLAPPVPLAKLNDNLGGNDGKFCYYYV